ncbi:MAG: hypothetical protein QOE97_3144 [Pseudonocardiales bacterium]|nr:hypothetical protein [Pseudonocardiales bacterium]
MSVLVACDLDQTLLHSARAIAEHGGAGAQLLCVEELAGEQQSFMTVAAAAALVELAEVAEVVPVTTRSLEQLRRVRLPWRPRFEVAANGGLIVVDGVVDEAWSRTLAMRLRGCARPDEVQRHADGVATARWLGSVRTVHDLFCYGLVERTGMPAGALEAERAWAADRGWRVSLQGRKLYWVPAPLEKAAAAREIWRRTGATTLLAAGDALLDADLLLAADAAIRPAHGELAAVGWQAPNVTVTDATGVIAGEQIAEWLLRSAARVAPAPAATAK